MATELVMPRLSDTMDSGTVAKWLKQVGDSVERGEVIAEIETDKANMEMESYASGILAKISVGEGESAAVGAPIAVVAASPEEAKQLNTAAEPPSSQEPKQRRSEPAATMEKTVPAGTSGGNGDHPQIAAAGRVGSAEPGERLRVSPLARRLAQERGIDLETLAGTGPNGRITKEDVLKQAAGTGKQGAAVEAPSPPSAERQPSKGRAGQRIEMSRTQQTIARRLTEARFTAPDFLLTAEIDMTSSAGLLTDLALEEGLPKIGPNDLLIKAAAVALTKHPEANSGWEDGIVRFHNINVGFAVATPGGGLIVPVVRNADRKPLREIVTEAKALRDKARQNKLSPSEYEDGTFTISNLGMFGIDQFTSILNPPEACSLAVGSINRKPVVLDDDEIEIRDRMRVTLTCDHRVINGAQGAEFLETLRRYLEHPSLLLI